ncbi:MAG: hypothetical protein SCK29_05700 [Bacillota bacterium]|nr:hypothetical protein [Bacillota bacterium]MDW7683599.1 hypothetical protein [Bacillota bacterium]
MTVFDVWAKGKNVVSRHKLLILIPLIVDLILYGPLMTKSLMGPSIHIKLTVPSSLPSIANLLPEASSLTTGPSDPVFMGITAYPGTLMVGFLGVLITLVVIPYLKAGYLGTIAQDLKNTEPALSFTQLARKYFVRLFILQLLTIAAFLIITPLMMIPLISAVVIIGMLILIILLFFWDYSVVYDDLDIVTAFKKALGIFTGNFPVMAAVLLPIALLLLPLTAFTSVVMTTPAFIAVIALYAYIGAVLVSGFMYLYANLTGAVDLE